MSKDNYVIGVDFGTDSVRTIIVSAANGVEVASAVFEYPRWKDGQFCNASENRFRQHPLDYLEGLETTIIRCVREAGPAATKNIRAISVDTTGSTPVAVDRAGVPLALTPGFEQDPDAMFILWKDHTALRETAHINEHSKSKQVDYLKYVGGIYSSEWYWAKLLHILRANEKLRSAAYSFVEHCDWIPFLLTGNSSCTSLKRGVCTAGHKGLWSAEWNGFPPSDFFTSLDPLLKGFPETLQGSVYTADKVAGNLSQAWSERLGLSTNVIVGIGAMDAHMGAVGGQIEPYVLSKVMGTSTCDMLVAPQQDMQGKFVQGICGMVDGSIIPGMIGMEAGQSAFGDVYAWFRQLLEWPLRHLLQDTVIPESIFQSIIPELSRRASQLTTSEDSELGIDWFNGRRTPDANAALKGAMTGLDLGSDAPGIFRALVESTCFGARAIVERFIAQGVPVKGLIGIGGVARKSPFIMQMLADVMQMPIKINKSEQTCALGAAMFASTAAGIYPGVETAMAAMGQGFDAEYHPDRSKSALYAQRFARYRDTGNFLGQQIESKSER